MQARPKQLKVSQILVFRKAHCQCGLLNALLNSILLLATACQDLANHFWILHHFLGYHSIKLSNSKSNIVLYHRSTVVLIHKKGQQCDVCLGSSKIVNPFNIPHRRPGTC
jgi:hypothetical protein